MSLENSLTTSGACRFLILPVLLVVDQIRVVPVMDVVHDGRKNDDTNLLAKGDGDTILDVTCICRVVVIIVALALAGIAAVAVRK